MSGTASFAGPVAVQTPRLLLRRPALDDAKEIFETYAQDREVTRFLTWHPHRSVDDTHAFLEYCDAAWRGRKAFPWMIVLRDTGALIGSIEARVERHRAEFGYTIARAAWGHGYATEAARTIVALALAAPDVHRVWAYVDQENAASIRVLEKAGLTREGCLRKWYVPSGFGVPRDVWVYAVIKEKA